MKDLDLTRQSVASLASLIRNKAVSPVEVTEAALSRIAAVDGKLNAFATVMADQARVAAKSAEKAILAGGYLGPFHGIPIGIKDIFHTRGVRTSAGSRVLANFVPDDDATLVARLKAAGAVIVGKTQTHEFAYGYVTPTTRNPWDTRRIPGGSSGGSGAAVASSMCAAATGSDTGGSIRVPAAMNGVVGLKPTFGRVSKRGVIVLSWSLDHVGPITRTVEDAALMMNVISGFDPQDPASADMPVPDFTAALKKNIAGVKLGIPAEHFLEPLDPEVAGAFHQAVGVLKAAGAEIQEVSLPHAGASVLAALYILISEAASYHERWFAAHADLYTPEVQGYIRMGRLLTAAHYIKAQRVRALVARDFDHAFEKVDALVTPTLPITAPLAGDPEVSAGKARMQLTEACGRNMYPLTMTGLPAISVPCGFSQAGLPIGLQIIGRPFDEAGILRIADHFQGITDWHARRPPI
jgi:aspartyl-tRNA(Asn)/glutamyl-tRNA(Gln) amidotransferase subunit A